MARERNIVPMTKRIIPLILSIVSLPVMALEDDYAFGHLSTTEGLNSGTVISLLENHDGFLWIGTEYGLCVHDGFQTFAILDGDNEMHTPIQSSITSLQEDARHHIWASTYSKGFVINSKGMLVDDASTLQELGMNGNNLHQLHVDHNGNLWNFQSDSVYFIDYATNQVSCYAAPHLEGIGAHLFSIAETTEKLYIVKGDHLLCLDKKEHNWQTLDMPEVLTKRKNMQAASRVKCYADKQNGLWIFSLFDEAIAYKPAESEEWQNITLHKTNTQEQNSIRTISEDSEGNIWIGTDHEGLYLYRRESGIQNNIRHNRNIMSSLGGNNVNCLLLDSHNTMWVGHFKSGISYHNPKYGILKHYAEEVGEVTAILADEDGSRWIGTDGNGLVHELKDHTLLQGALPGVTITSLVKDPSGTLWIGTYAHGLYRLHNHQLTHYSYYNGKLPHDNVTRMVVDDKGFLWICSTFGSFYKLDTQKMLYDIVREEGDKELQALSICYDPEGTIHLGTVWGLWSNNAVTMRGERRFGLSDEQPFCEEQFRSLYFDTERKHLWMSHREGVSIWDQKNNRLYELPHGNPNQSHIVHSLVADKNGNVWFNTDESVSVATSVEENGQYSFTVRTFSTSDLKRPNISFNSSASAMTPDGHLLFGCSDGYCEIDPEYAFAQSSAIPTPSFALVYYNNEAISTEGGKVQLRYDQYPLHILLFAGNPIDTDIRYSYRIKGVSEEWVKVNGNRIDLSGLPWGMHFELDVRACDSDGIWSEPETLIIDTELPLLLSPLMLAIYLLIVAACVAAAWRIVWVHQRKKSIRRHREKLHEQFAKMNREKLQQMGELFKNLQQENLKAQEYIAELKAQNDKEENVETQHKSFNQTDEDFIQHCITLSEQNMGDSNFGVEELGQIIGMSRSQLYKRFMALTGRSPLDVIRSVRMKHAKQLMDNSHLSSSEIAQIVGYNTLKTFTENFKQEYGMTPAEYQRRNIS